MDGGSPAVFAQARTRKSALGIPLFGQYLDRENPQINLTPVAFLRKHDFEPVMFGGSRTTKVRQFGFEALSDFAERLYRHSVPVHLLLRCIAAQCARHLDL